jgi:hypothetical protein
MGIIEWLNANAGSGLVLVLLLLLAAMVLLIINVSRVNRIAKETIENTLNIKVDFIASTAESKDIKLGIYNSNFRDIIISAFGFVYFDQQIDFFGNYRKETGQVEMKVVVSARSNIEYVLPVELLESIIFANNFRHRHIKKLQAYIIDSIGAKKVVSARHIRAILKRRLKERELLAKEAALANRDPNLRWYTKLMFWKPQTVETSTKKTVSIPKKTTKSRSTNTKE